MKSESRPASPGKGFKLAAVLIIILVGVVAIRHARSGKVVLPVEPADGDGGSSEPLNSDNRSAEDADGGSRPYQRRSGNARPASLKVQRFQSQYCAAVGPQGWTVIDENAQRAGFGADFTSGDRMAYASYMIFPSGALTGGSGTPEQAVANSLSNFGTVQVRFGRPQQIGPNIFLLEHLTATNHGVAFYQVIPAGADGAMIVMRTAGTGTAPGMWENRASEAMAVARSIRCQVPMVPAGPDPPELNSKSGSASNNSDDSDTLYNTWLDMEYYHNSQTGENYWVSPSKDYSQVGPDGPGYYAPYGGNLIKLTPGYAHD